MATALELLRRPKQLAAGVERRPNGEGAGSGGPAPTACIPRSRLLLAARSYSMASFGGWRRPRGAMADAAHPHRRSGDRH